MRLNTMKIKILLTLVAIANCLRLSAVEITTTAGGTINQHIGDDTDISILKVNGPINAADFEYITSTLTSLSTLDLSNTTIEALSGVRTASGNSEFKANELPKYALFGTRISEIKLPESIIKIGEAALGSSAISSINIPTSVTAIDDYAFVGCNNLSEINIPSTVLEIGVGLFKECIALKKATIASPIATITDSMFEGCTNLSQINLQPLYNSIGNDSFANCTSLSEFHFSNSITTIGDNSFYNSGLTTISLENCNQLTSIGDFAFAQCKNLETISLGNKSIALGKGMFFNDTALLQVQLPSSTTEIPAFTFKGTTSIDSETALPIGTKEIGDYALYGWELAESLLLPERVEYIGSGAMEGWTSLQKLGAENLSAVPSLGNDVWAGLSQGDIYLYVNDATADEFKAADQWKEFTIVVGTSAIDEIINDANEESGNANVEFIIGDGYLKAISKGADIANIRIFDLNGRNRYIADVNTTSLIVNTSQWQSSVIIVDVQLTDNTHATVKLSI